MRIAILAALACLTLSPSVEAAPLYHPVPAALYRPGGGLGNVFAKLQASREVRIAYLGGSITAANGWRPKSLEWFRQNFPRAKVAEINAAIGGTGSDLGVFRLQHDVLDHRPDLLFVEFAVNDSGTPPGRIFQSMEGIVRQAWRHDPNLDICFVYTFVTGFEADLNRSVCPRAMSCHELVAEHYGIPAINVALPIARLAREGKLVVRAADPKAPEARGKILFSTDGVHPLDAGHNIYRDVIADALKPAVTAPAHAAAHVLKAPLTADNWENARMLPLARDMLSPGWRKLDAGDPVARNFLNRMPAVWMASRPGETIRFKFKGTTALLYDLMGPDAGQVVITVDGKESPPRPRFDSFCSYHRLATQSLGEDLPDTVHTVTVRLHPEPPDRSSVTNVERKKPGFDPKRYEGTVLRVGAVLLVGDLVR